MKSYLVISHCLLLLSSSLAQRFQRLTWPSENAELKIVPHVEIPMTMAPSVQSGMNFRLPITLQFPSYSDVMRPMRNTAALVAAASDPVTSPSRQREEDDSSIFVNRTRANSRAMFYKSVEKHSSKWGEDCLLRAVCEVGEIPSINSGSGIIGEVIDLLLTSSHLMGSSSLDKYIQAEHFGRDNLIKGDQCKVKYKRCPFSLFNVIKIFG